MSSDVEMWMDYGQWVRTTTVVQLNKWITGMFRLIMMQVGAYPQDIADIVTVRS